MSDPSYVPLTGGNSTASSNTEYASRRFTYLQEEAPELGFDSIVVIS